MSSMAYPSLALPAAQGSAWWTKVLIGSLLIGLLVAQCETPNAKQHLDDPSSTDGIDHAPGGRDPTGSVGGFSDSGGFSGGDPGSSF